MEIFTVGVFKHYSASLIPQHMLASSGCPFPCADETHKGSAVHLLWLQDRHKVVPLQPSVPGSSHPFKYLLQKLSISKRCFMLPDSHFSSLFPSCTLFFNCSGWYFLYSKQPECHRLFLAPVALDSLVSLTAVDSDHHVHRARPSPWDCAAAVSVRTLLDAPATKDPNEQWWLLFHSFSVIDSAWWSISAEREKSCPHDMTTSISLG